MTKMYVLLLALLLAALGAFAQGINRGAAGAGTMLQTDKGIFALREGVLLKIDATTFKPVGNPLELFGPAPKRPDGNFQENREALMAYFAEIAQRSAPPIVVAKGNDLIIVIGTSFFRVNQDTMKVDVDTDFAGPGDGGNNNRGGMQMGAMTAPAYLLTDNVLVLLRPREMVALNLKDGSVVNRSALPAQMMPQALNFNTGGGNRGGGNRGGGGAAAGGATAPAAPAK